VVLPAGLARAVSRPSDPILPPGAHVGNHWDQNPLVRQSLASRGGGPELGLRPAHPAGDLCLRPAPHPKRFGCLVLGLRPVQPGLYDPENDDHARRAGQPLAARPGMGDDAAHEGDGGEGRGEEFQETIMTLKFRISSCDLRAHNKNMAMF
jgi:hypothetical protein